MCTAGNGGNFGIVQTMAGPGTITHNHLTGPGGTLTTAVQLVAQINAGTPPSFQLPSEADHIHVITFTMAEYTTLRNGGSITKITGLDDTGHRHTYRIDCMG
jgi:hypothetical protein